MEGNLTINVKSALMNEDNDEGEIFAGKMDPYCKIEYEAIVKNTSVRKEAGKNPVWNDEFVIRVFSDKQIKLTVLDSDAISSETCGVYEGTVASLLGENPDKDQEFEIVVTLMVGDKEAGTLTVGTKFDKC